MTLPTGLGWLLRFDAAPADAWDPDAHGPLQLDVRSWNDDSCRLMLAARLLDAEAGRWRCSFGYCNDPATSDALRQQGFRVLDAEICWSAEGRFEVRLDGSEPVLTIEGLVPPATPPALLHEASAREPANPRWEPLPRNLVYRQEVQAPDPGQPDSALSVRDCDVKQQAMLQDADAASVALAAGTSSLSASAAWRAQWQDQPAQDSPGPRGRVDRAGRWPFPPAYRFTEVEALGFRLDLSESCKTRGEIGAQLVDMVSELNFHRRLNGNGAPQDFEFRPASATLVVELLRYGSMQSEPPAPGPAQCQHELLLRVLVGRVDDASGQARDPCFYVPAIFVDSAWSRMLGRELQGFDKRLAAFCTSDGTVLRTDGRRPGESTVRPLDELCSVRIVDRLGAPPGVALFELSGVPPAHEEDFVAVDEAIVLAGLDISGLGWRQADFDAVDFRRAFARSTMASRLNGFRSVQTSPIDGRDLQKTWIGAHCAFENLRVLQPPAQPRVRLHAARGAAAAWNRIADLAVGRWLALPAGDWYRLRFDMTLKVDDGLAW